MSRVSRLCPTFRVQPAAFPPEASKPDVAPTCGTKNSTEAKHSGSGRKMRCSGMDETCRLRRGGGYGACIDEAAKQDKAAGSCAPRGGHLCPPCGQFQGMKMALFCGCQKQNDAVIPQKPRNVSKIKDNFDAITSSGGFEHENRRTKPLHRLDGGYGLAEVQEHYAGWTFFMNSR